jgi:hypothetical protein
MAFGIESQIQKEQREAKETATKNLVEHKRRIIKALEDLGHKVKHEDLENEYISEYWEVDDESVKLTAKFEYDGPGVYSKCTGSVRFYISGWGSKKAFIQLKAAAKLKKFPEGFDYKAIAQQMVAEAQRNIRNRAANKAARVRQNRSEAIEEKLRTEFGLTGFGTIDTESDRDTLEVKFTGCTEEQVRALLKAAQSVGLLSHPTDDDA